MIIVAIRDRPSEGVDDSREIRSRIDEVQSVPRDILSLRESIRRVKYCYIPIIVVDLIRCSTLYESRSESLIAEPYSSTLDKPKYSELPIGIENIPIGLS